MEIIEEKIQRIAKEIQEANATQWTITKIVKGLTESKLTSEKRLRERALELLKELDQNAAIIYERFSKMQVYTSNEKIKQFNRGNIITSLVKETTIPRSVAEKITIEVENQIKDSKIEFLTPSLIRELVNAKLISYGLENIRENYTRVGEPIYDVKQKLTLAPYSGESVREYNIIFELPKKARELHFNSTIFIEDIEGYSHRPYSYSFTAETKETPEKTIFFALKQIQQNRKYFFLQPSIYGLTFACAPFVRSLSQAKKIAELIIETSQLLDEKVLLSLELFTPKIFEKIGDQRLNAAKIAGFLLDENVVVGVDSQYSIKLLNIKGKQFMVLNNSAEEYYPLSKQLFSPTQGIDLFVNINLEKIGGGDDKSFFEELKNVSEIIEELKMRKKDLLKSRAYLKQFKIEELKTAIGITNLVQLAEKYSPAKPLEFASKAYKEISKLFENDLIFGLGSEKAKKRFSESTSKEILSQDTLGFDECLKEKKCCFTGKAGTIKELNELIEKKVKQIEFIGAN